MNKAFTLAFRIWLIAACCNTLLAAMYLTGFFSYEGDVVGIFLFLGFIFSLLCSIPGFIVLWVVLRRCISSGTSGLSTLGITMFSGLVASIISFLVFRYAFDMGYKEFQMLFIICILSGITGVACQSHPILDLPGAKPQNITDHED